MREQQLSAAQQKSSSQSLQIIAPKPPPLGYPHHGAFPPPGALFSGQQATSPSLPLGFEPHLYGLSAIPSTPQYTFPSPETIGSFPPGSWRQGTQSHPPTEPPLDPFHANLEAPSLTADTGHSAHHHHVSQVVPQPESVSFLDKGKANAEATLQFGRYDYAVSEDDDGSMAESDDETSMGQSELAVPLDQLGLIVSQRAHDRYDFSATQPRTFSVHPDVGVLSTYEADFAASPLLNKQNSAIFWHFVNVTGPSMSMYERDSLDAIPTHQQGASVQARRHLWSCKHCVSPRKCAATDTARHFPHPLIQSPGSPAGHPRAGQPSDREASRSAANNVPEALPSVSPTGRTEHREAQQACTAGKSGGDAPPGLL